MFAVAVFVSWVMLTPWVEDVMLMQATPFVPVHVPVKVKLFAQGKDISGQLSGFDPS